MAATWAFSCLLKGSGKSMAHRCHAATSLAATDLPPHLVSGMGSGQTANWRVQGVKAVEIVSTSG
jgi:hypothetical protein